MWKLDDTARVPHWRPEVPLADARLAFSTRRGGISAPPFDSLNLGRSTRDTPGAVTENRARLLVSLGLAPERLATAGQVHGVRVVEVAEPGHQSECDALVTRVPRLALAVTTADCMSLLYVAPGGVASAHAGWRGTADGMPGAVLSALCACAGCRPEHVQVHIGPCIRACCYEVGVEVASRFPSAAVQARDDSRPHLDLPLAARRQLESAGVRPEAVFDTGACTACEPFWYFSHRRDSGRTGRLWGIAALEP
ncbi:MAG: laccase domain-containing protein [Candidatus Eisenbacteria bacterium]|nr:laccase domain-containing protein [Candidatus Eisenbacteria bacterium]